MFITVVVWSLSEVWLFTNLWAIACTRALCPWNFPGKNAGVGYHFLLQGIFLTQGQNWCLLHCGQILYRWAAWEVAHKRTSPLLLISFPFRSPHSTESSSLCDTVGSHQLVLYLIYTYRWCVYVNPNLPIHPTSLPHLVSICLFSMSKSLFLLCK